MTTTITHLALGLGALLVAALLAPTTAEARGGRGRGGRAGGGGGSQILEARFQAIPSVPLTQPEVDKVTFLREEEKLARDVYDTLGQKWSLPIFKNIRGAEQRHMDRLLLIFNLYKLPDPVTDDTTGVFTNPELAALYDQLVAQGSASLVGALQVGATIEDLDIADIDELLASTSNDHIRLVAQNLVKGSRNHLRAFMKTLTSQGGAYTPQYLSAEAFAAILATDQERGPVDENGDALSTGNGKRGEGKRGRRGNGNGQGRGQGRGCGRGDGSCDGSGQRGRGNGNCDGSGRGRNGSRRGGRGGNAEEASGS